MLAGFFLGRLCQDVLRVAAQHGSAVLRTVSVYHTLLDTQQLSRETRRNQPSDQEEMLRRLNLSQYVTLVIS